MYTLRGAKVPAEVRTRSGGRLHCWGLTFETSAAAFGNPDHVAIVIHNYRWRLGLAPGRPVTTNWSGDLAQGRMPASSRGSTSTGWVKGGVGHNLPQEAPAAFAQAMMDVDRRR
jgi:hypothetical protein